MVSITEGAGFIGSYTVHYWIETTRDVTVNVDTLTYAGNLQCLAGAIGNPRHIFLRADVGDTEAISQIPAKYRPRAIINLAAEGHVDRSIHEPDAFIQTNVAGTLRLLRAVHAYWSALPEAKRTHSAFFSTRQPTRSMARLTKKVLRRSAKPRPMRGIAPYAASKAASDHRVRARHGARHRRMRVAGNNRPACR
jgi:dTDP-glucose 4,6-dehydratase